MHTDVMILMWLGSSTKGLKENVSFEHYTVIKKSIVPLAIMHLLVGEGICGVLIYSKVNKYDF